MVSLRDFPTEPGPTTGTPGNMSVGYTFRVFDVKYHVRGIVDKNLVCCFWRPAKQRWEYVVLDRAWHAATKDHIEMMRPEKFKPGDM